MSAMQTGVRAKNRNATGRGSHERQKKPEESGRIRRLRHNRDLLQFRTWNSRTGTSASGPTLQPDRIPARGLLAGQQKGAKSSETFAESL